MDREQVISNYINATENILQVFGLGIKAKPEDVKTLTLGTKKFTNALRELYLSNDKNKDEKYKVIFDIVSRASYLIIKENFSTNPIGTYWSVIIYNLELAYSHISELHFKETDHYYPLPKVQSISEANKPEDPSLTHNQIALKYVYSGMHITRENSFEIALKHNQTSGEKLYQKFNFYSSTANRKATPDPYSCRKINNKIELLESILPLVKKECQSRITDEVSILKNVREANSR